MRKACRIADIQARREEVLDEREDFQQRVLFLCLSAEGLIREEEPESSGYHD